jgi:hypothetical protein
MTDRQKYSCSTCKIEVPAEVSSLQVHEQYFKEPIHTSSYVGLGYSSCGGDAEGEESQGVAATDSKAS